MLVVDALEVVEVEQAHAQHPMLALRFGHPRAHLLEETAAQEQPGQGVLLGALPAQPRAIDAHLDAREQLGGEDRLGEEVVRAGLEGGHPALRRGVGREAQDGQLLPARLRPQQAAHVEPAEVRHRGVEEDEIGPLAAKDQQDRRRLAQHGRADPGAAQDRGHPLAEGPIVVHDQDVRSPRLEGGRELVDRQAEGVGVERLGQEERRAGVGRRDPALQIVAARHEGERHRLAARQLAQAPGQARRPGRARVEERRVRRGRARPRQRLGLVLHALDFDQEPEAQRGDVTQVAGVAVDHEDAGGRDPLLRRGGVAGGLRQGDLDGGAHVVEVPLHGGPDRAALRRARGVQASEGDVHPAGGGADRAEPEGRGRAVEPVEERPRRRDRLGGVRAPGGADRPVEIAHAAGQPPAVVGVEGDEIARQRGASALGPRGGGRPLAHRAAPPSARSRSWTAPSRVRSEALALTRWRVGPRVRAARSRAPSSRPE